MKVLFVSSGNFYLGITSVIKRQADSLSENGIEISHFFIKGKGLLGYMSNLRTLRSFMKREKPDVVHAHYSLSAYLSALAGAKPLIVSLMGSDVKRQWYKNIPFKIFYFLFRPQIIVKSDKMYRELRIRKASVIPNGVDLKQFCPMAKDMCRQKLGWDLQKFYVLFAANPSRKEKKYNLARQAFVNAGLPNAELVSLNDVFPEHVPVWMNAADIVILTSEKEGSPNVVKEAMACNKPVVSTDVGDVRFLLEGVKTSFISTHDPGVISRKLNEAADSILKGEISNGRDRIIMLSLDSETVAGRIIQIYNSLCEKGR